MSNALDLLDSLLQNGMKKSTAGRLEHSLSEKGIGGSGGILDELLGGVLGKASPSTTSGATASGSAGARGGAAAEGGLGGLLGSLLGGSDNLKTGAIGAIAGAILGGGGKSMKGAIKGGALAVLGSLALQALRAAGEKQAASQPLDGTAKLSAGLRAPVDDRETEHLESVSQLIVSAMVNAAKADGRVDESELKRILGNVERDGVNPLTREFLAAELRKPMDTDALVRAVNGPQLAAQVYAASLMAIELDTPQEKQYLAELAQKLGLSDEVVRRLHAAVGLA